MNIARLHHRNQLYGRRHIVFYRKVDSLRSMISAATAPYAKDRPTVEQFYKCAKEQFKLMI